MSSWLSPQEIYGNSCTWTLKIRNVHWFPQSTFELLLSGQTASSNVDVILLLILLESRKELLEEVRSWWSGKRGLNWQQCNSYIMPQPTELFCHTFPIFVKSNMLISFNPLTRGYWGNMQPHMVFQWSNGIVSPLKYRESFS